MTLQQIVENIQEVFPTKSETQVKLDVNAAHKAFAEKTRICVKSANLTLGSVHALLLDAPTDFDKAITVSAYDSTGADLGDIVGWTVTAAGKFQFNVSDDSTALTMPSEIATLTLSYVFVPAALTTDSSVPDVPSQYHEAIENAVLAKYCRKAGKWQLARECNLQYARITVDAIKEANEGKRASAPSLDIVEY